MEIRCITTGSGDKGSVIVCDTPNGTVSFKARKITSHKYDIYSEVPSGKYKTVMYVGNRRELRRRIEDWLEQELSKGGENA